MYLGDFVAGATIDFKWNTMLNGTGSITRATDGTIKVYKNNSTTERSSAAGITDTEDFDSRTGVHHCRIDLSDNTDAGFYAAGNDYQVLITGMVIGGFTINSVIAEFSIENRNIKANVTQWNSSAVATPNVSGVPKVDITHLLGTAWLTPGVAGTPDVNVRYISADSAAADNAESFFDGTGYAGTNNVIPTVTTLTNLPSIPNNWLTAAGINTGAITAAKFAAGAIDAAAIATDAIGSAEFSQAAADKVWSSATRILTANTNLNDLSAAGVRSAVGLASANLDTQLSTIAGYIDTEVAAILAAVDTEIAAIKAKTDNLPSDPADASDIAALIDALPTAAEVRAEMDTNSTKLAAIDAKTTNLPSDPADASDIAARFDTLDTSIADLPTNAELATALGTADDATLAAIAGVDAKVDTVDTVVDAIKAKTDNLPASPAAVGSAMTLTSAYDFAKGTVAMTEAYAANGVAPTPIQAMFAIHQMLMQHAISGTTWNAYKLNNVDVAFAVTLDDATNPTSARRV